MWRRPVACELTGYQPAHPLGAVKEYVRVGKIRGLNGPMRIIQLH
jgi:hypothetical protein